MRRFMLLAVAVLLMSLTGCGNFKDIKVNSANIEKISPYGLRGVDIAFAIEVDNPASQIKLSDMEATLNHSGKVIGKVTVDPFTMKKRSVEVYHLNARVNLGDGVSLYDMVMLMDDKVLGECLVDVTAKGKLKNGLAKTITRKDIPLKKLLEYAEQKK